jgi:hypothetical protein
MATDTVVQATGSVLSAARVLGALSLLAVGTMFVMNFVGATLVGLGLLGAFLAARPVSRARPRR